MSSRRFRKPFKAEPAPVPASGPVLGPASGSAFGPAFVTGASSGIGAAIAQRLAGRGLATVLLARRRDRLEAVARQCRVHARSVVEPIDLSVSEQLAGRVRSMMDEHGEPGVLVNCAGVGMYGRFLDQRPECEDHLYRLNYLAASRLIRILLPAMLERGCGRVINITSISTKMSPWGHGGYTPTKAALVALTQTLAADYANTGVSFSYVNPGIVDTDYFRQSQAMHCLWARVQRRAIDADRVARGVVKLLDRPRLEVCIPRRYRIVDLLRFVSPTQTHRLVAHHSS